METIQDFFDQAIVEDEAGTDSAVFTEWLPFVDLTLKGGTLQFVETRVLGLRGNDQYECVEIAATPGVFRVEVKGVRYGDDKRNAGMRALPVGSEPSHRGEKIGEIPVDLGGISVMDIDTVWQSMHEDKDEYEEWIEDILFGDDYSEIKVHEWGKTGTIIPTVESGFGDGVYDVYALLDTSGNAIGMEVVFIAEGQAHPFA